MKKIKNFNFFILIFCLGLEYFLYLNFNNLINPNSSRVKIVLYVILNLACLNYIFEYFFNKLDRSLNKIFTTKENKEKINIQEKLQKKIRELECIKNIQNKENTYIDNEFIKILKRKNKISIFE
ncbi:MAG: hypothetical protein KGV57_02180 [Fusobacterium sp.]|nr:hypothetical protein [Fusobacterium sp.]